MSTKYFKLVLTFGAIIIVFFFYAGCGSNEKFSSLVSPTNLQATAVSSSEIDLSWTDNSDNEDGFKIERKTGTEGIYSQIGTVVAGVTSYQDGGLTCEITYYYRVRAYQGAEDSDYSFEANATTYACPVIAAPIAPSGLTATVISGAQINLSWTDNSDNEDGFKIERKTGTIGYTQIGTVGAGVITYQDSGLDCGTTFYYRVRAYNKDAGSSGSSNELDAQTSSCPSTNWLANKISAGYSHACVITSSGGVKCWGANYNGQLGNGMTADSSNPVNVFGLSSGINAISAGEDYNCALISSVGVKCWGGNQYGQLGYATPSSTPVDVSGLANGISAISAGAGHTCVITSSGGVKCWGSSEYGQLGNGTSTGNSTTPVDVSSLTSGVIAISVGESHTCAITSSGGVKCWGSNCNGQLGDGTTINRLTPVDVSGLTSGVIAISAGFRHTCAITSSGGVKCWGLNGDGQLGDGTVIGGPWGLYGATADSSSPVDVSGLSSGVIAVSAGLSHTCAITSSGGAECWGWNDYGQLGDWDSFDSPIPADVAGLSSGVIAISTGGKHTCAITSSGGVKCWGWNHFGQLGGGSTNDTETTPVDVVGTGP